jgi:hypothetical protein
LHLVAEQPIQRDEKMSTEELIRFSAAHSAHLTCLFRGDCSRL